MRVTFRGRQEHRLHLSTTKTTMNTCPTGNERRNTITCADSERDGLSSHGTTRRKNNYQRTGETTCSNLIASTRHFRSTVRSFPRVHREVEPTVSPQGDITPPRQTRPHLELRIVEVHAVVGVRDVDRRKIKLGEARIQHWHQVVRKKLRHLPPQLLRGQPRPQHLLLGRRRKHSFDLRRRPREGVVHL